MIFTGKHFGKREFERGRKICNDEKRKVFPVYISRAGATNGPLEQLQTISHVKPPLDQWTFAQGQNVGPMLLHRHVGHRAQPVTNALPLTVTQPRGTCNGIHMDLLEFATWLSQDPPSGTSRSVTSVKTPQDSRHPHRGLGLFQ